MPGRQISTKPVVTIAALVALLVVISGVIFSVTLLVKNVFGAEAQAATSVSEAGPVRVINIGGTGILEKIPSGYILIAPMSPRIELGVVNADTIVNEYGAGPAATDFSQFVGKRITVMATVEAVVDSERVFAPIFARSITVLARQGVID